MASQNMADTLREEVRLRTELEQARGEFADSIVAIQDRIYDATDWRTLFRRRPVLVLVGGLTLGLILARWTAARWRDDR